MEKGRHTILRTGVERDPLRVRKIRKRRVYFYFLIYPAQFLQKRVYRVERGRAAIVAKTTYFSQLSRLCSLFANLNNCAEYHYT